MLNDNMAMMGNAESRFGGRKQNPPAGGRARGALAGMVLVAALLLPGCSGKGEKAPEPPTVTVEVVLAQSATIQRKVTANAVLYPLQQAALVPKISAPVAKFYVERGSPVH